MSAPVAPLLASWFEVASAAWNCGMKGDIEESRKTYAFLDSRLKEGQINADLSVLRHSVGTGTGRIVSPDFTETVVASVSLSACAEESPDSYQMTTPIIDGHELETNILRFLIEFDPGWHRQNIKKELPHVLVLSTGRCGTVSLHRLFETSALMSFHAYWWQVHHQHRLAMMARFLSGEFLGLEPTHVWMATRAAEWIGAINEGRPMIGHCHYDTIFAPVFASLHPLSKFVYLRRDPVKVFESYFGKGQWSDRQLRPIRFAFDPEFRWRSMGHDLPDQLAWYIHFTETFSRAFGRVMGNRFLEVDADKLFAQEADEIEKLLAFTGADLSINDGKAHFASKFNEKAHRGVISDDQMIAPRAAFERATLQVQQEGRL